MQTLFTRCTFQPFSVTELRVHVEHLIWEDSSATLIAVSMLTTLSVITDGLWQYYLKSYWHTTLVNTRAKFWSFSYQNDLTCSTISFATQSLNLMLSGFEIFCYCHSIRCGPRGYKRYIRSFWYPLAFDFSTGLQKHLQMFPPGNVILRLNFM